MNNRSRLLPCPAPYVSACNTGSLPADLSAPARKTSRAPFLALLLVMGFILAPLTCQAVPSFARQTGLACIACHTQFPELNAFGRQFKLTGYTLAPTPSDLPPFAVMFQPSFTHTGKSQAGGAATGFSPNNNFALTQASLFYAGRLFGPYADKLFGPDGAALANKFGIFSQTTYDGVADRLHWDNTELRFSDVGEIAEKPVMYGVYLNNNPTLQDPWNTVPAWSFPYSQTGLGAQSPPSPLIDGALAQQVGGVGAFIFYDNSFYLDVAGYRTLSGPMQNSLGITPDGETQVTGFAPYWRAAYTKAVDNNSYEIGTFGLLTESYPGRDSSSGTDRILDIGFDAQAQFALESQDITFMASWIHEQQNWGASHNLGLAANPSDYLEKFKLTADYLYDKTYGFSAQYFATGGSTDAIVYGNTVPGALGSSATNSPASDGVVLALSWLPFNKNGGPDFWPKSNLKVSLAYTIYDRINGAHNNYDGAGANASDNNTLYLEVWVAF